MARNRRVTRALDLRPVEPNRASEGFAMHIFQIRQTSSGAILWTGNASDAPSALDAMAREAGYTHYDALPDTIRAAGIVAMELTQLG